METKINKSSSSYAVRCAEIIRADKNISEATLIIMFLEYGQLLLQDSHLIKK